MSTPNLPRAITRLGFHYFPDTLHYREIDIHAWLPEFKATGVSWLTLLAPPGRAIPEFFIRSLIHANIEPVLHFHFSLRRRPDMNSLSLLFKVYAEWGVRYVVLFDRPNLRAAWSGNAWAQSDLVERFLDVFLPIADLAFQAGLQPVFPPLEPGGDYWDTAFLRAALQGIQRRGDSALIDSLVLGAYAWVNEKRLGWGAGGPESWPQAKPYHTPAGHEDQRGFYIFDWYLAIAEAQLGHPLPILLVGAGFPPAANRSKNAKDPEIDTHTLTHLNIARLMMGKPVDGALESDTLWPVSAHVLACNFWLLAADPGSPEAGSAWYRADGSNLPIVSALRQLQQNPDSGSTEVHINSKSAANLAVSARPIAHYLLLPEATGADCNLVPADLWNYICQHHPTVGFSLEEAALAARVTIYGEQPALTESDFSWLRSAGCSLEHLGGNGTSIAPQAVTQHTD
jgi:hypothetical protein